MLQALVGGSRFFLNWRDSIVFFSCIQCAFGGHRSQQHLVVLAVAIDDFWVGEVPLVLVARLIFKILIIECRDRLRLKPHTTLLRLQDHKLISFTLILISLSRAAAIAENLFEFLFHFHPFILVFLFCLFLFFIDVQYIN